MIINIYTQAGEDVGYGHAVRMGHLHRLLRLRGNQVTIWTNDEGAAYFEAADIPALSLSDNESPIAGADIAIVDRMINDDGFLAELRPRVKKLVVVVGAGHTITPVTRWIADLIIYQTPVLPDLEGATPGEKILQGLGWIMMDPRFAEIDTTLEDRPYDFAAYFGGGINQRFVKPLLEELTEIRAYNIRVMGHEGEVWRSRPYDILRSANMYIGSMGMTAYEAIVTRTKPIVFCRSEDHEASAAELVEYDLAYSRGMLTRPTKKHSVQTAADMIEEIYDNYRSKKWNSVRYGAGKRLDGKGLYRVAREVLKDV